MQTGAAETLRCDDSQRHLGTRGMRYEDANRSFLQRRLPRCPSSGGISNTLCNPRAYSAASVAAQRAGDGGQMHSSHTKRHHRSGQGRLILKRAGCK